MRSGESQQTAGNRQRSASLGLHRKRAPHQPQLTSFYQAGGTLLAYAVSVLKFMCLYVQFTPLTHPKLLFYNNILLQADYVTVYKTAEISVSGEVLLLRNMKVI